MNEPTTRLREGQALDDAEAWLWRVQAMRYDRERLLCRLFVGICVGLTAVEAAAMLLLLAGWRP